MSQYLFQQLVNGLALGSLYALVAIGFSMIYGIVRLINFAHGDLVMVGAFAALTMVQAGVPWLMVAALVLLVGALSGMTIEAAIFRPMRGATQVTGFIATLAVSVLIQNGALLLLSGQQRSFQFPAVMRRRVEIGGVSASMTDLTIIALTAVLISVLLFVVYRTRLGIAMRATSENLLAARLMGVPVNRTIISG